MEYLCLYSIGSADDHNRKVLLLTRSSRIQAKLRDRIETMRIHETEGISSQLYALLLVLYSLVLAEAMDVVDQLEDTLDQMASISSGVRLQSH